MRWTTASQCSFHITEKPLGWGLGDDLVVPGKDQDRLGRATSQASPHNQVHTPPELTAPQWMRPFLQASEIYRSCLIFCPRAKRLVCPGCKQALLEQLPFLWRCCALHTPLRDWGRVLYRPSRICFIPTLNKYLLSTYYAPGVFQALEIQERRRQTNLPGKLAFWDSRQTMNNCVTAGGGKWSGKTKWGLESESWGRATAILDHILNPVYTCVHVVAHTCVCTHAYKPWRKSPSRKLFTTYKCPIYIDLVSILLSNFGVLLELCGIPVKIYISWIQLSRF